MSYGDEQGGIILLQGRSEQQSISTTLHICHPKLINYFFNNSNNKNDHYRASLVAQWLRICLPMQGTRVRALVWEDPTQIGRAHV